MLEFLFALLLLTVLTPLVFAMRRNARAAMAVCAFVAVFSVTLYGIIGAPEVVIMQARAREAAREIARLEKAAEASPDDAQGWASIGQKAMETGQYDASARAYRRAVLLTQGQPGMILQYNKALIFAAGGEVTEEAERGLNIVLLMDKGNPEARYFLALRQLQQGRAEEAMQEMKTLYRELKEDSPLKAVIDRQIGRK